LDYEFMMRIDPHAYAENFILEDEFQIRARARGAEVGANDATTGVGSYLRALAHQLSAHSGVGSLWILSGMITSGTLTSIDDETEHSRIARIAMQDADIAPSRYRLITNSIMDVMTKLTDRAYDLVVLRHNPEDLTYTIEEAHRILRSGGVMVIDGFFGGGKVSDPSQRDPRTIALREAGKSVKGDTDLWVSTLITVGDGLLIATKL
jgi:predicted O-methyltransferase YrrM